MKLEGTFPIPSLTAIIDHRGDVSILGEELRVARGKTGRTNARCHCKACGAAGHIASNRACPRRRA